MSRICIYVFMYKLLGCSFLARHMGRCVGLHVSALLLGVMGPFSRCLEASVWRLDIDSSLRRNLHSMSRVKPTTIFIHTNLHRYSYRFLHLVFSSHLLSLSLVFVCFFSALAPSSSGQSSLERRRRRRRYRSLFNSVVQHFL